MFMQWKGRKAGFIFINHPEKYLLGEIIQYCCSSRKSPWMF